MRFLSLIVLLPVLAFAQEQVPVEQQKDIVAILSGIIAKIPSEGAIVMLVAGIVDFVLRLVKTEKPKSVLYLVADVVKLVGEGIKKLGELLDKVLPQRVK